MTPTGVNTSEKKSVNGTRALIHPSACAHTGASYARAERALRRYRSLHRCERAAIVLHRARHCTGTTAQALRLEYFAVKK